MSLRGAVPAGCRSPVLNQSRGRRFLYSARGHSWHYHYILDGVEEVSKAGASVLAYTCG